MRALSAPAEARSIATTRRPAQLGRPALEGSRLVYHATSRRNSRIVEVDLATFRSRVLRSSSTQVVANPSIFGAELAYVRQTNLAQLVVIGPLTTSKLDRVIYRIGPPSLHDRGHEPGHSKRTRTPHPRAAKWLVWTTALSASHAYVTLLPRIGSATGAQLISISR